MLHAHDPSTAQDVANDLDMKRSAARPLMAETGSAHQSLSSNFECLSCTHRPAPLRGLVQGAMTASSFTNGCASCTPTAAPSMSRRMHHILLMTAADY